MKKMIPFFHFLLFSLSLFSQDKKPYTDSALYYLNNPAHVNCLKCRFQDSAVYFLNLQDYKNAAIILEKMLESQNDTDWFTPISLGQAYWHLEKYEKVEPQLKRGLERLESKGDTSTFTYVIPLFYLGCFYYFENNDLTKSKKIMNNILAIREKNNLIYDPQYFVAKLFLAEILLKENNLDQATKICEEIMLRAENEQVSITDYYPKFILSKIQDIFFITGTSLYERKDYINVIRLINEVKNIKEINKEYDTAYVQSTLFLLAECYFKIGKLDSAELYFLRCLDYFQLISSDDVLNYFVFTELAEIYHHDHEKVESILLRGITMNNAKFGINNAHSSHLLYSLHLYCYMVVGANEKSKEVLSKALSIQSKLNGDQSKEYAKIATELSEVYSWDLEYVKAEEYINHALLIYSKEEGYEYVGCLNSKSDILNGLGKYDEALALLFKSISIQTKMKIVNNSLLFSSRLKLANTYEKAGNYDTAIKEYEKLYTEYVYSSKNKKTEFVSKVENEKRRTNYDVFLAYYGSLLSFQGKYEKAEKMFIQALSEGADSSTLINLSDLYLRQERYKESEECINNIVAYYERTNNKPFLIRGLKQLASVYHATFRTNEAIDVLDRALSLENAIYQEDYFEKTTTHLVLALYNEEVGKFSAAHTHWADNFRIINNIIKDKMLFLTDKEKVLFVNKYSWITNALYSKLFYDDKNLNLSEISYDNELRSKQLTLRSYGMLKEVIRHTKDEGIKCKFDSLIVIKKNLLLYDEIPLMRVNEDIQKLKNHKQSLERFLNKVSSEFQASQKYADLNWVEIHSKLKSEEVIIEVLKFNIGGDTSVYAALILQSSLKRPLYVPLFFAQKDLELALSTSNVMTDSTTTNLLYSYLEKGNTLYTWIWKPLEPFLTEKSQVYICPSGVLNNINLSAIPINVSTKVDEKYDIHILGTSAEIINFNSSFLNLNTVKNAIVIGGVDYDKRTNKPFDTKYEKNQIGYLQVADIASRSATRKFGYLQGTKDEARNILNLCRANEITSILFSGDEATEEMFKSLSGKRDPYILHIATHGYFFPDPELEKQVEPQSPFLVQERKNIFKWSDDPLLRSGLIFAGANNTWGKADYVSDSTEDGILTSYEISNLDLSNCQLVVLSACETGLGDIKGSEGVFGLQRAFKMAGVKNIIMSLWKVPDVETQELMTLFYNYCFAGKSVHDALQSAQSDMKKKYPPYYWAAFKLLE